MISGFLFGVPVVLLALGNPPPLADESAVSDPPGLGSMDGVVMRDQAGSWEDLVRALRPTLTWNGRDMLWVMVDASGKPSVFVMDRAYGGHQGWATLDDDGTLTGFRSLNGEYTKVRAPVRPVLERDDPVPESQGVILSRNAKFGTLYRVYWQERPCMGTGNILQGRWILVLREPRGSWRFIGELPGESSGKIGGFHHVTTDIEMRARWTGDPDAPVRIDFTAGKYDWEVGEHPVGLPPLATLRDGVLEGKPPAKPVWGASQYVVAEPKDTLASVVHRLSVWSLGWSSDRPGERLGIEAIHRKALKELNPGIPEDSIPPGTRIKVLGYEEFSKALDELRLRP